MVKTLIIYAHPTIKQEGHCSSVLDEVKTRLDMMNQDYEVIDLYKIGYDPVLHEDELYTAHNKNITNQNKEFQKKIERSKNFIFIYPVWWNSTPAILKGFFDKVLTSGFAFIYKNNMPIGLLKGRKAVIFATTGAPKLFFKLFERSIATRQVEKYTLGFCGIKARSFVVGNSLQIDEKQKNKIQKTVKKGLDYLYKNK
jgi:NAD(P)H dehydrogenase (quinone)